MAMEEKGHKKGSMEEKSVQVWTMWEERSKKGTVGGSGGEIRIGQWRRRDIRKGQEEDRYTRMCQWRRGIQKGLWRIKVLL